jgi:hypothetical protein
MGPCSAISLSSTAVVRSRCRTKSPMRTASPRRTPLSSYSRTAKSSLAAASLRIDSRAKARASLASSKAATVAPSESMMEKVISPAYTAAGTTSATAATSLSGLPQIVMWPPGSPRSSYAKPRPDLSVTLAMESPTATGCPRRAASCARSCQRSRASSSERNADIPSISPGTVAERPRGVLPRSASDRKSSRRRGSSALAVRTNRNTSRSTSAETTSTRCNSGCLPPGKTSRFLRSSRSRTAGSWRAPQNRAG